MGSTVAIIAGVKKAAAVKLAAFKTRAAKRCGTAARAIKRKTKAEIKKHRKTWMKAWRHICTALAKHEKSGKRISLRKLIKLKRECRMKVYKLYKKMHI